MHPISHRQGDTIIFSAGKSLHGIHCHGNTIRISRPQNHTKISVRSFGSRHRGLRVCGRIPPKPEFSGASEMPCPPIVRLFDVYAAVPDVPSSIATMPYLQENEGREGMGIRESGRRKGERSGRERVTGGRREDERGEGREEKEGKGIRE